jgi:hypothetical protein
MAEAKNHFLGGKMNKDIEDRLLKNSEYRDALNITVGKAGENNVGSIENLKSNALVYAESLGHLNAQPIGYVVDEKNDCIYWFITTFAFETGIKEYPTVDDYCAILKYDQKNSILSSVLEKRFLRFCKKHLITGVNIVGDYLFWTDNFNQPRRIDLSINSNFYNYDEQLSIPRCVPYLAPTVLIKNDAGDIVNSMQNDITISSNFLKERFVRFSYRFKFIDNSYSPIAPFTQILFIPKEFFQTSDIVSTYKTTENVCMVNTINRIISKIELPSHNMYEDYFVKGIEILLKESDSTIIRSIEYIDIKNYNDTTSTRYNDTWEIEDDLGNGNIFYHEYKSNTPSKTLPESQYLRVWDRVPRLAKAQELAGSRIVYGNYLENYRLPELDYFVDYDNKDDLDFWLEYPNHSVKQNRNYQVGIVLTDVVGRSSSVIISKNATDSYVFVDYLNSAQPNVDDLPWHGLALQMNFRSPIPNPYSTRTELFIDSVNYYVDYVFDETYNLDKYTFYGDVDTELFEGDWLLGKNGNHVRILKIDGNEVHTEGKINDIYSNYHTTDPVGKVYKYKINKDGWYSYKIVVKQKEQEYYNVYTPGVVNYKDRSWITLHGDNINKVPRDLTMTGRQDGTYASSTILYAKVVKNRFPSGIHNQQGSIQYDLTVFPTSVVSIGTASDQKIEITTGTGTSAVTTNAKWLYEYDKDHLLAEIEDNADLNGETRFGLYVDYIPATSTTPTPTPRIDPLKEFNAKSDGTPQYTIDQAELHLGVFETKPIESLLDVFWETSTVGLVEELNESILLYSDEGEEGNPNLPGELTIVDENDEPIDYFYESWAEGKIICRVQALENGYPITSYELLRVYNQLPGPTNQIDRTGAFTIDNPGTGYATIALQPGPGDDNYYFENALLNPVGGNFPGHFRNVFTFVIKVNTDAGSVERSFIMNLKNSYPYMSYYISSNSTWPSGLFFNLRDWWQYASITQSPEVLWSTPFYNGGYQNKPASYIYAGNGSVPRVVDTSPIPISPPVQWLNSNDDLVHTIYSITRYDQDDNIIPAPTSGPEITLQGGGQTTGLRPTEVLQINSLFQSILPRKLKTYHIVIQSSDCNSAIGSLTTQLNGATVTNGVANKLTHMHEMFIDVGEITMGGGSDGTLQDQRKRNKYELTHCPLIPYADTKIVSYLQSKCVDGFGDSNGYLIRNMPVGDVYKLIDEEWWKCRYYFFKDSRTSSTLYGHPYIQFYCRAIEKVSGYLPSFRAGNVVTSVSYGKTTGDPFWGPTGTLTTPTGKELRTYTDTSSWYASWITRVLCYNVYGARAYRIVVEWDNDTDDISKVYLLYETNGF